MVHQIYGQTHHIGVCAFHFYDFAKPDPLLHAVSAGFVKRLATPDIVIDFRVTQVGKPDLRYPGHHLFLFFGQQADTCDHCVLLP